MIIGWDYWIGLLDGFFPPQYGLCCGTFLAGTFFCFCLLPQTGSVVQLPRRGDFFFLFNVTFSKVVIFDQTKLFLDQCF